MTGEMGLKVKCRTETTPFNELYLCVCVDVCGEGVIIWADEQYRGLVM